MPPVSFGGWGDAEELRKWSFLRRTPQQRLDWLVEALTISLLARSAESTPSAVGTPSGEAQTGPASLSDRGASARDNAPESVRLPTDRTKD
jgi:hypothetical protein